MELVKKEVVKKAGASRGAKKVTAGPVAPGVADVESAAVIDAGPRKKSRPELTVTQETTVTTIHTCGRISRRALAEDREDAALSTLNFSVITGIGQHVPEPTEDVLDTALGIALVASALEKKVTRVTPTFNAPAAIEGYTESAPTRNKSQTPTSVAPLNSIDSDETGHGNAESEIRLSQSDVHIGFPEDICAVAAILVAKDSTEERSVALIARNDGIAMSATAMSGVAAHEEVGDAPTDPGEVATPMSESVNTEGETSIMPDVTRTPTIAPVMPGSEEEKAARKVRYDAKRVMIREIAASQLHQEELAKSDPNLVSVSSFILHEQSLRRRSGGRLLKETAELFIQKGIAEKKMSDALQQKRTTLEEGDISAQAETVLILSDTVEAEPGEFLGEHNPVVALGELRNRTTSTILVAGQTCETEMCGIAIITDARDDTSLANDGTVRVGDVVAHGLDESDAISLDDTLCL